MKGSVKGLLLIGASALVVFAFWGVVERGGQLARMGSSPATEMTHLDAADPPPMAAPADLQPLPPPKLFSPPAQPETAETQATVYRWVDENGGIHFSDRPGTAGSQPLAVSPVQTIDMPAPQVRRVLVPSTGTSHRYTGVSASDYHISRIASHQGSALVLHGRIEGGPDCTTLRLRASARNSHGGMASGTTVVKDVGSISRLWEIHAGYAPSGSSWEVVDVQVSCLD